MDFAFLPTAFIVYWILVHCRVGSLEIKPCPVARLAKVHCRVGSLEIQEYHELLVVTVHCRVGSLESIIF